MEARKTPQARRRSLVDARRCIRRLLDERPSREALEKRGIYRRARTQITGSYVDEAWVWTRGSSECVSRLDVGIGFTVAISSHGDLLANGSPQFVSHETLSLQSSSKKTSTATLCHPPKATDRKVPRSEAAVLTTDATSGFPIVTRLLSSSEHSVRHVACGVSHCVALVQDSTGNLELRSWGLGRYGQLGLGSHTQVATAMAPITTSLELLGALAANCSRPQAFQVSCGPLSSCVTLTNAVSTSVWLWGLLPSPQSAHSFIQQHLPSSEIVEECPFRVDQVALGLAHLTLLCETGRVFTWGHNACGQLGRGLQFEQAAVGNRPSEVIFHHQEAVFGSISCGYDHTLARSRDESHVFAWGSNRLGACGATTKFFEYSHPVLVGLARDGERIQSISCKAHTSTAVISGHGTGRLVVWGVSGIHTAQLLPSPVDSLDCADITISAGYGVIHSLVEAVNDTTREAAQAPHPVGETAAVEQQPQLIPTIVGLSVVASPTNGALRLSDLNWTRPVLHHIRVVTGDVLVLLIQSEVVLHATELTLLHSSNVEFLQSVVLHAASNLHLSLVAVAVESVEQLAVHWHDNQSPSDAVTLLSIDCCLHPHARDAVLANHHQFLVACFDNAFTTDPHAPEDAAFHDFLTSICRNHEIDDAIAYSSLSVTRERDRLDCAALDVDRLAVEKAWRQSSERHRATEIPTSFGLWRRYLEACDECEYHDCNLEGLSLWDLLMTLDQSASPSSNHAEMLYQTIANQPIEWNLPSQEHPPEDAQQQAQRAFHSPSSSVSLSSPLKLCVPQNALDFLVSGSEIHAALHTNDHQDNALDESPSRAIRFWQSDRGDSFYSHCGLRSEASDGAGVVQIHLPDDFHDSSRSTPVRKFQYELHRFLWSVVDARGLSVRKLYSHLGRICDSEQLQTSVTRLGFHARASREAWHSTFTTFLHRTEDPSESQRLTLHALRVFLVDPFHHEFFRNYVADWPDALQAQQRSQVRPRDLLANAFDCDARDFQRQPWTDFVAGLKRLHASVRWELEDSDVCRLLYHFDALGDGHIDLHSFLECLVGQVPETTEIKGRPRTAIDPSRRRPDLDAFATPDAMRKLFKTRAHKAPDRRVVRQTTESEVSRLLRIGNTRLAQIRNLPVSKLLSEGVHFRPRATKYHGNSCTDSEEDTA